MKNPTIINAVAFFESALSLDFCVHRIDEIFDWLEQQCKATRVEVKRTEFARLAHWSFAGAPQKLRHDSGRFFAIEGVRVRTNGTDKKEWDQPIIDQPEIGYLGFIVKKINGVLHFLMQAKIEPGNIKGVQLSPTLQATKSNYTKIHRGKTPDYLEYFQRVRPENVLLDQLQSEQGARFLKKRNRNMIIEVEGDIEVLPNFIWVSLGQIKELMRHENVVNMDARTVVSSINFASNEIGMRMPPGAGKQNLFLRSLFDKENALHTFDSIVQFVTSQKCRLELKLKR